MRSIGLLNKKYDKGNTPTKSFLSSLAERDSYLSVQNVTSYTRRHFLTGAGATLLSAALPAFGETPASATTINDAALPPAPVAHANPPVASTTAPDEAYTVTDLEIPTVTPTSITFSWSVYRTPHTPHLFPNERRASDAEVWLSDKTTGPLTRVHQSYSRTGLHFVTITGLRPNTTYRFECRSLGRVATPGLWFTIRNKEPETQGKVHTLSRPGGRYLHSMAISNDIHLGKKGHSVTTEPWPEAMIMGMLSDVKRRGIDRIYINGDLCDNGSLAEARRLKELLDTFGQYHKNYFLTRGNHDGYAALTDPLNYSQDKDPIAAVFPHLAPQHAWIVRDHGFRVLGIDTSYPGLTGGHITSQQFTQIEKLLAADPYRPTIVMAHHPVTEAAARSDMRPNIVNAKDALQLQQLFQKAPGVFFMAAGHTHRAHRDAPDLPGGPQFAQLGAAGPYPGGYAILDFYEGGYTVTFHRTATATALAQTAFNRYKSGYE